MTPALDQFLNKTILVSAPAVYGDTTCRACRLVGTDLQGLWLEVTGTKRQLLPAEAHSYAPDNLTMFIPFSQICCVLTSVPNPGISAGKNPPLKKRSRRNRNT